jgi:hypothetical protein
MLSGMAFLHQYAASHGITLGISTAEACERMNALAEALRRQPEGTPTSD